MLHYEGKYPDKPPGIFYRAQTEEGSIFPIEALHSSIQFQNFLCQTLSNQQVGCDA
jgi:hypothetical protein